MSNSTFNIYLSYSQLCIFSSFLKKPFNDWSERNFTQGFSWRPHSVSFRSLLPEGRHKINFFLDRSVPDVPECVVRSFRVPFEVSDCEIEIGSISESKKIKIFPGEYALQVEFLKIIDGESPEINVRINKGTSDFLILKHDEDISVDGEFDLHAVPAE